ncbi:MAG: hypothetical protein IAF38_19770 [Bacteroidia bacterium]|nr:hypothetical protein [Bacteroidia bacterium]
MRKKISIIILLMSLISCSWKVKQTAQYYNKNKALTMSLYENYLKISKGLPREGFSIRGKNGVELRYKDSKKKSHSVYFTGSGEFINGTSDSLNIVFFKSDLVKKFILDYEKSQFLAIDQGYDNDYVFFSYGNARKNNREYIGILITDKGEKFEIIKKIEEKVYVYETDVP